MILKRSKGLKGTGKGALMIIMLLLLSSATIRLGAGAGPAIAQAVENTETSAEVAGPPNRKVVDKRSTSNAEIGALLEALTKREAKLAKKEKRMQMRKTALDVAGREVEKRIRSLEKMEKQLRQTLSLADGAAEGDLAQLTDVYETMKAKDSALLFETMDPPFAAGFLGRMRPDSAAAIMAGLTPETAYTISVILASRNTKVPKN